MQAEDMPGGTVGPHLPDFARPTSGAQALDGPAAGDAAVAEPVVETVGLVLPELDGLWVDPVAAPERRQRHLAVAVARRQLLQPLLQLGPAGDHLALRGCPRSELAADRPGAEVRLGLVAAHPLDGTLDADLSHLRRPPEDQRDGGVAGQLVRLAAAVVRVEDEPALVEALEQDHPSRGPAARARGRQRHGGGLDQVGRLGLREPVPELHDRVGVDMGLIQRAQRWLLPRRVVGRTAAPTLALVEAPGTAASRTKATSWPPGTVNSPNPWDASARTMVQPKNTPTAMPRVAPSTEMITASQRIIDRTWARVAPTSRSRPSSRTRSNTDRASVFTIPNSAMMIANASRMRTRLSNWSSCLPTCCLYWAMSWTCTFGKSATTLSMAPRTLAASTPGLTSAITIESSWVP